MKIHLFILLLIALSEIGFTAAVQSPNNMTGPKLRLDYHPDANSSNPVDCFMYFVPLTSPTSVTVATDPGTTFRATITSWKTTRKDNTVHVECDFEVTGQGGYRAYYVPEEMIRHSLSREQKAKELTRLLEWIRLDGPCLGQIDGYGKVVGDDIQMDSVEVSFTRKNTKSPVHVSIYDVPKRNGKFLFENRENSQVARINSLKFNCNNNGIPRMAVEIASLKKPQKKEGVFSRLTALIANILFTSTPVATVGNSTMMDFGEALYEREPVFTFPAAANIETSL